MTLKKLFAAFIALVLLITLAGCKNTIVKETGTYCPNAELEVLEGLRGTTVVYVTCEEPETGDYGVAIAHFEKKYDITVKMQLINRNTFLSTINSDIVAGIGGDVVLDDGSFPYSLSFLQPLETTGLDLEDPMWNKSILKASTFNGHPYLIDAVSNKWSEFDLCFYNKQLFKENDLKNPEEYYKEGKWTVENFRKAAYSIASLGEDYSGVSLLEYSPYALAQTSFFTVKNNEVQITNEKRFTDTLSLLSQMNQDGVTMLARRGLNNGMLGMALSTCKGLMKTGYFSTMNPEHIGVTYMPVWNEGEKPQLTSLYRGWGLLKDAKNPVGAGLFLKEYLDVENYDLENEIHSKELINFFYEITGQNSDEIIYYTGMENAYHSSEIRSAWYKNSPAELVEYFASETERMNKMIEEANKIIEDERAWIKEAEEKGYFK